MWTDSSFRQGQDQEGEPLTSKESRFVWFIICAFTLGPMIVLALIARSCA